MKAGSVLEKVLTKGLFAVTAELNPPRGNRLDLLEKKAESLKGAVDAVNVTDNPSAIVQMSSLAACIALVQMGLEPILEMTTRDRNRIALQSDLFGATAHGIKNVLALTGDHQCFGNQPEAKNVHDLDSVQLIRCLRDLRDQGMLLGGEEKGEGEIRLFIGGVSNPFADPMELHLLHLTKKVRAGADFIQTQCIYDMDGFERWLERVRDLGLTEKVYLLVGVSPLRSEDRSHYLKKNLAGISLPPTLIERLIHAKQPDEEGIKICVEQIQALKEMKGVHGIHITATEYEPPVRQIVEMAGLSPRPKVE